jgi:alpha-amylase
MASAQSVSWWEDAVFYEVFVRSFYDSDGDGIGDIRGLIEKLDYLNDGDPATTSDLGVDALWLMPITVSPSDHGYDVVDYYAVDPDYGTLDDVRQLLAEAHARGMHVIIDLVLNHTSSESPWFEASRGRASEYRDWYLWTTPAPQYQGPWGQRVWHFGGTGYYYGLFWSEMPDLNYRNPAVSLQMFDIARFWLNEVGVDGFRLDAVRHLIENGEAQENTPATHFWLKGFSAVSKGWNPSALLLGEVWDAPETILPYLDHELDLCFEFELAGAILGGVRNARASTITEALQHILSVYPPGQYAPFLSNHDQERVMTQLRENEAKAKVAAAILLTLPGTPFVYYGEEIGMTGAKPDERIRTPMQWSDDDHAGFTAGVPWESPAEDWMTRNVSRQTNDPGSLLSTYRTLIQLRNETPALRTGDLILVDVGHLGIVSYIRKGADSLLWILHNVSAFAARPSRLVPDQELVLAGDYRAEDLLRGVTPFTLGVHASTLAGAVPALASNQTVILELHPI